MAAEDGNSELTSRLALFDDEPDINDWFEVALGAAMVTMGIHQLFNPGGLFDTSVMQWLGAAVTALGLIMIGHGIKDMLLKEIRTSIVRLDMAEKGEDAVNYALIRDVLLHPDQYQQLLYEAYQLAYADGVLTEEEVAELSAIARVLQIPERSAARMATRAAIQSALEDDHVSEAELDLIIGAARPLGLSEEELERIVDALRDHKLDEHERSMLDELLGQIPDDGSIFDDYSIDKDSDSEDEESDSKDDDSDSKDEESDSKDDDDGSGSDGYEENIHSSAQGGFG